MKQCTIRRTGLFGLHLYRPRWAKRGSLCWLFGHDFFMYGSGKYGPACICVFHPKIHKYFEWDK